MNDPIVLNSLGRRNKRVAKRRTRPKPQSAHHVDPLSEVVALLKPQGYSSGGFALPANVAIHFPKHQGIKCYAMLAGQCWLVVDGIPGPVLLKAGDCFLLPRGLPFRLATDLSVEPVHYTIAWERFGIAGKTLEVAKDAPYIAGGHFALNGNHAEMLLQSLPPIVHIRREPDKIALRWSLELMREELRVPQPGGLLIVQQLAYVMVVQALRVHLTDVASAGPGWLNALSEKHMRLAIANMHRAPDHPWTLQSLAESAGLSRSVFASRFREIVGSTPMEYLTQWRMLLAADRLKSSPDGLRAIAQSLGYESESAFGRAFRRIMGCSPRQYTRPTAPYTIAVQNSSDDHKQEPAANE